MFLIGMIGQVIRHPRSRFLPQPSISIHVGIAPIREHLGQPTVDIHGKNRRYPAENPPHGGVRSQALGARSLSIG